MGIIRSPFSIRRKNRVHAKLQIREERMIGNWVGRFVSIIYIAFALVDWSSLNYRTDVLLNSLILRLALASIGLAGYRILRGRLRYGSRFFLVYGSFLLGTQVIMLSYSLAYTPYFIGIALVMFSANSLSPMRWKMALAVHTFAVSPTLIYFILHLKTDGQLALMGVSNTIGMIVLCIANTTYIRKEVEGKLISAEELSTVLRTREAEVRAKAAELIKRKRFEAQFSPQIVKSVLENDGAFDKMQTEIISTIVIDVKDSTLKANQLAPKNYTDVLEEVFDVITSACINWNITIDKFTGDGAQAFAGSPNKHRDDLERAVMACCEIQRRLEVKKKSLEARWGGPLELRFAVCEGEALVGFFGKGTLRSYTAVGSNVSFAHRLCARTEPNSISVYSVLRESLDHIFSEENFIKSLKDFDSLKGFGDKSFKILELISLGNSETRSAAPLVLLK